MYGFKDVDVAGLESLRAATQVDLIDVRSEAELARGRIPGARHIPLHMLPLNSDVLDRSRPKVLYCQTGGRSAQASAFLAAKGHDNVYNLQGGISAWVRSGKPLAS